jgi:general secretion pathway protein D
MKKFLIVAASLLISINNVFAEEDIKLPPSLTPEQIKAFLSKPKKDDFVILNFDDADLRDVINTISSITGESFILSPGLEARITIHSAKKIPVSEVLSVFESILEANGMSLVKSGDFYKIVLSTTTKQKPLEVQKGRETESIPYGDRPVTQIIPVEYVPVTEVSSVLKPMLSQFGSIIPNPRNNLLIINDIASNIKRLLNVLKEIDVDAFQNTRMAFFQLKYSDVKTLSTELAEILNALNLSKEGVALVPIERINSLVVFASSPSLLKKVEGWIKKLDEEVMTGQNIFVYHVQNVKAESIATILKELYEREDKKPRPLPSPTKRKSPHRVSSSLTSLKTATFSKVEIVTFEPTNSLVILASPGIYREIKEIIKKLDVYPKEVLIEVVIAEVTLTETDQFGIQWSVLHNLSIEGTDIKGLIQSRSRDAPSYTLPPTLGTDSASASVTASGLSYLLFKPDRLVALLHALASRGKLNILSSPRLLVRDQEEASIEVGSDIPTATSTTTDVTTSTLTQNIEYKTVGIKLKIKPSINDEKTVVLDIEQEVSDTLANVTVGPEGFSYPAFSTRITKTTIVVPDRQGIIIGGIMKERKERTYQGIPILSAIPILGNLFRYTVETRAKTELIVLLTPHVVVNKNEAEVLTTNFIRKLREVKKYLEGYKNQIDIIDDNSPPVPEKDKPDNSI